MIDSEKRKKMMIDIECILVNAAVFCEGMSCGNMGMSDMLYKGMAKGAFEILNIALYKAYEDMEQLNMDKGGVLNV